MLLVEPATRARPASHPLLQTLVRTARLATDARIVQITRFDRPSGLIESLAWSGFRGSLPEAAIRVVRKLFPDFDPYHVRPRVDINRWNVQVYLHGQPVLAPFDEVAFGAVDHKILAVAMAVGKIRRSYLHPLRVGGEIFGAFGFHAQQIDDDQQRLMDGFVEIAEELLAVLETQADACTAGTR